MVLVIGVMGSSARQSGGVGGERLEAVWVDSKSVVTVFRNMFSSVSRGLGGTCSDVRVK